MKFMSKIKGIFKNESSGMNLNQLSEWYSKNMFAVLDSNPELTSDLAEIIYYICLKHLSETVAKLPWEKVIITEKKEKKNFLTVIWICC